MGAGVQESPIAPLIAFSAATNLGVAGREVRLDPARTRLAEVLRGFGALVIRDPAARTPDFGVVPPSHHTAGERIDFARAHMPTARAGAAALGDRVRGMRIGISLVLEPKTAVLALLLAEAGADVHVFAFAIETDDEVAAELRRRGVTVHAESGATPDREREHALALLDAHPDLLIDDGAHVVRLAHAERPDVVARLLGASEETTSGVTPLRAMAADGALRVPVIAANDAVAKSWFDNRHGTGETCVLAIVRTLDDDLDGARVAVIGFGPVGEGCAERLRVLGAEVTVVDRDPRRALAARFAGYRVAPVLDAVARADLIVSATGVRGTVDAEVLAACPPDAAIAVAGGAPEEVLLPPGVRRVRLAPHLERLELPLRTRFAAENVSGVATEARTVRLLAEGECVNIVAGEGNPIDVMDLSFAVQLAAVGRLLDGGLVPGVHELGDDADARVAAAALGAAASASRPAAAVDWRRTRFDLER